MKKLGIIVIFAALAWAWKPIILQKVMLEPLAELIQEAANGWEEARASKGEPERDEHGTWLDVGVRHKYFVLHDFINIRRIEEYVGTPVFQDGPHDEDINFDSDEFGHYNPMFLKKVKGVLSAAIENETFKNTTQDFYGAELQSMTRSFYRAYLYLQEHPEKVEEYKRNMNIYDVFTDFYFYDKEFDKNVQVSEVAAGFWVRRMMDGTTQQFFSLLEMVLKAYDPMYQKKVAGADVFRFNVVAAMSSWYQMKYLRGEPNKREHGTWLDVGVRYKYFVMKSFVNPKTLGKAAGVPVFKKGPHGKGIDFNSEEFGHYNPLFLEKVKGMLYDAMSMPGFNSVAQKYYDKELRNMARTYYNAYKFISRSSDPIAEYGTNYDYMKFIAFSNVEEKKEHDGYVAVVAPGFWVRRIADGTDKQFLNLLEMVLDKYDEGFER